MINTISLPGSQWPSDVNQFQGNPLSGRRKKWRFLTEIAVYFGNATR